MFDGFSAGNAIQHALVSAEVRCRGAPVLHGRAMFLVVPAPAGRKISPMPWQQPPPPPPTLAFADLDTEERAVVAASEAALLRADGQHGFITHFWGVLPEKDSDGARCDIEPGPQHANRVGHMQGGILVGLAAASFSY